MSTGMFFTLADHDAAREGKAVVTRSAAAYIPPSPQITSPPGGPTFEMKAPLLSKTKLSPSLSRKTATAIKRTLDPVADAMNSFEIPTVVDTVAAGWPQDFTKIATPIAKWGIISCSIGFIATIIEQRYPKNERVKKALAIIDAIRDGVNAGTWMLIAECSFVADVLVLRYRARHNGHDENFADETNISTGAFIVLCIPAALLCGLQITVKLAEEFKDVKKAITNKVSEYGLAFLTRCLDLAQDSSTIFSAVQIIEITAKLEPFSPADYAIRYFVTAAATFAVTLLRDLWKNKKSNLANLERFIDYLSAGTYAQLNIQLLLALVDPLWQLVHLIVWIGFTSCSASNALYLFNQPDEDDDELVSDVSHMIQEAEKAAGLQPNSAASTGDGNSAVIANPGVAHLPAVVGSPIFSGIPAQQPTPRVNVPPVYSPAQLCVFEM
jgi:hypothetical protein